MTTVDITGTDDEIRVALKQILEDMAHPAQENEQEETLLDLVNRNIYTAIEKGKAEETLQWLGVRNELIASGGI